MVDQGMVEVQKVWFLMVHQIHHQIVKFPIHVVLIYQLYLE